MRGQERKEWDKNREKEPAAAREDLLGTGRCNEYEGDFATQTYTIQVDAKGSGNNVNIFGFYNVGNGLPVVGEVQGSSLYIYPQTVDGIQFSGTGTMNNTLDQVEISFSANDGGGTDQVRAMWIR